VFGQEVVALPELRDRVTHHAANNGAAGSLLLVLPTVEDTRTKALAACRTMSALAGIHPVAIGLPPNAVMIRDLGTELAALEAVRETRPELEGDGVARREVDARIAAVAALLEEELRGAFGDAVWYVRGSSDHATGASALARLVSRMADETFPEAPIIHSELVNRERPSSNSKRSADGTAVRG
jgi:hypothetical protein